MTTSGRIIITQGDAPEMPASGKTVLYVKADKKLYIKDDQGIETLIATSSGTDHGALMGLSDDDHTQYFNTSRGDARYYTQEQTDAISGTIIAQVPTNYISDVVDDTTPQLGGNLDTNEKSILWQPSVSTNESWSGDTITMAVDVNDFGFGATLYIAPDGNLETCDADSSTFIPCFALATESGLGLKDVLLRGFIRDDSWDWTPGGLLYTSATTGGMTQTTLSGSGQKLQILGRALTADVVYFNPDFTYIEIA